jgi:hypothetical protein
MRGTIKKNEAVGRRIERLMAEKLEGNVVGPEAGRSGPYDVESKCCLFEVKSSLKRTCGSTIKGKVYCHIGRFVIVEGSHNALPIEAERMSKEPEYSWVIHDDRGDVLTHKEMLWKDANGLLEMYATKHSRGNMILLSLRIDRVFNKAELGSI